MTDQTTNTDVLIVERDERVATLTLNRPDARNAMNFDLATAICDALESCQDMGAIVITGSGKGFCAGLDMRNLGVENVSDLPKIAVQVRASKVPVIAAVNGAAITNGFELALACDFIVASEHAKFADTHVRVRAFPGSVMLDLPPRVGMAWAREMTLTGNFVDAETALRIGLINHLVPAEDLVPFAKKLAADITEGDASLITQIREAWDAIDGLPYEEAVTLRRELSAKSGSGKRSAAQIAAHRDDVLSRAKDQNK